jgi:hypothetical protein
MSESALQTEELHGRSAVSQLLHHSRFRTGAHFGAGRCRLNIVGRNHDHPALVGHDIVAEDNRLSAAREDSVSVPMRALPAPLWTTPRAKTGKPRG